jgi:uncharacterized protein
VDENEALKRTEEFVRSKMGEDKSGHDWWHIRRVVLLAERVAGEERANVFVVKLAALLHDIGESGPAEKHVTSCAEVARGFLNTLGLEETVVERVCECILTHSWSDKIGKPKTLEGKIVADCDALDASGAQGICRTVQYYNSKGLPLHDPSLKRNENFEGRSSTMINHFYEKLFLLGDTMYTETCKRIARDRVEFMKDFVERFLDEWDGVR